MIIEDDSGFSQALNQRLRDILQMPPEGRRLHTIFSERLNSQHRESTPEKWDTYLASLGLKPEETDAPDLKGADGPLTIPDPFEHKWPKRKYITVPKELALKILALEALP